VSSAPIKKLPASPRVSQPSIPVADRGGEEVNVGFGDLGAGRSNQLKTRLALRRDLEIARQKEKVLTLSK
jgi:hypothetical protein